MSFRPGSWSRRAVGRLWGGGLLLEAVLLLVMFALLRRPDLHLIARLRGARAPAQMITFRADIAQPGTVARGFPAAAEDSFYTVLRWPPGRPLLEGGGHVVALPMHLWWVPALYVFAVPFLLLGLTVAWLWRKRGW